LTLYRPKVLGCIVGWCTVDGKWTELNAADRSGSKDNPQAVGLVLDHIAQTRKSRSFSLNPVVSRTSPVSYLGLIPRTRLHLPEPLGHPINLTIFKRNTDGALGEQVATTGPYSDTLSGVCITKTKLEAGIYLFIPSTYDKGTECAWTLNVWSDVGLSAENAK